MATMPSARLVLKALRTRFWDERPFVLSHLLTARCNADCATCLWKMPADARVSELDAEQVEHLYHDAAAAGFRELVLWGGEPMVRPDAGTALRAARAAGLETTLITNGWWLEERAHEVLPHTSRLLVSVDGMGERHDATRRCPGLFERLDRGLAAARAHYPRTRVVILSVLSRLSVTELEGIAEYGARLGVPVVFQAMNGTDYGSADRAIAGAGLELDADEWARVAGRIEALRRRGLPVRDSSAYLRRLGDRAGAYRCHYKKVVLRVEPNGDVLDCTLTASPLGSVRTTRLSALVATAPYRDFVRRAEACNRCRDAGVIETSHMWEGHPGALWNALETI
jgi:MoaA/NifB/PqqE/SkfB family radical SAM enzyme